MIAAQAVLALRSEWSLREDVIEKDYVLGWMLAAIAANEELRETWVFKGGTCLRKCYYETYRFSEDLDFTVVESGREEPESLMALLPRLGAWLYENSGIEVDVDQSSFSRRRNKRGNPTTQGRVGFKGPLRSPQVPKLRIDLTTDEILVQPPQIRAVGHPYEDELPGEGIYCYSIVELLAEKLRALVERCRPRDLYDVVHVYRHPDLIGQSTSVLSVLDQKCAHAGIGVPDAEALRNSPYRDEGETEWGNMLGHQLPHLPPFSEFWGLIDDVFDWLAGGSRARLPRAEPTGVQVDPVWAPPRAMVSWRRGPPLELIRFAGANRLKVEIDYRAEEGRWGPRVIEPYSFRMTREGNLVLFVLNDLGQLRSYRVDRIAGVRVLDQTFQPRYFVEF